MATTAQLEANRQNAQASTGPRTDEGKAHSSQNAAKFGLFSKSNFVLSGERDEYDELYQSLWERLRPLDVLEGAFATEVIRATWRLRRCANVEGHLADAANATGQTADAMESPAEAPVQASVDRARTQTLGTLNRAIVELRRLQTERRLRTETLPAQIEPDSLGVSNTHQVSAGISANIAARMDMGKAEKIESDNMLAEIVSAPPPVDLPVDLNDFIKQYRADLAETKETQTARGAQCPCGSGRKFKRCCGVAAPASLHHKAAA
jgi:hypothetical protein